MRMRFVLPISVLLLLGAAPLNRETARAPTFGDAPALRAIAPLFGEDQGGTRAVLLIDGGQIRAKRYAPGYSDANRFMSWSMAKTVTGILVGELVEDGRLTLDAPAPLAEWRRAGDPRGAITLRHLLNMSSGLRHTEVGEPVHASDTNQVEFVGGTDQMAALAIVRPLEARPGSAFEYSTLTSIILSEIITRTLTSSRDPRVRADAYRRFADERLFRPSGIRSAFLEFDGAGTQVGGSFIYMTLGDWGRLGGLLLDGRAEDGTTVITSEWLHFMRSPAPTSGEYGGQLWLNRPSGRSDRPLLFPGAPMTTISAEGHLGQHVTVSPDSGNGVVLVRLGHLDDRYFRNVTRVIGRILRDLDNVAVSTTERH